MSQRLHVRYLNECPEYVYKYCTAEIFDMYAKAGSFKLGTLHQYREDYEIGAGYGDNYEGTLAVISKPDDGAGGDAIEKKFGRYGAAIVEFRRNAYIFSVSRGYSEEHHRKWLERPKCKYDLCLKISGPRFFEQMARKVKFQYSGADTFVARPVFGPALYKTSEMSCSKESFFLNKQPSCEWEDELRLVCVHPHIAWDFKRPLYVQSSRLAQCIVDVISID